MKLALVFVFNCRFRCPHEGKSSMYKLTGEDGITIQAKRFRGREAVKGMKRKSKFVPARTILPAN